MPTRSMNRSKTRRENKSRQQRHAAARARDGAPSPVLSESRGKRAPEALFYAVYISQMRPGLLRRDIEAMVAIAVERNRIDGITGFLVQAGPSFIQYLEGPHAIVRGCLRRIEHDTRHREMRVLAATFIAARRFTRWEMGYFVGDASGTDRIEPALSNWPGTDTSLVAEVIRITREARLLADPANASLHMGPFPVLMRRAGYP